MFLLKTKELVKSKKFNQASGGLSDEEINQIVKDAESNKERIKRKEKLLMQEIKQIH